MGGKILIADDDTEMLSALSRLLAGYEVEEAANGKTAVALAFSGRPELVILDIDMPDMNGIEVLEKLSGSGRKPLVIMLTGSGAPETVSKAMELGVFAYIIKPFEPVELLTQVNRAFAFLESRKDL